MKRGCFEAENGLKPHSLGSDLGPVGMLKADIFNLFGDRKSINLEQATITHKQASTLLSCFGHDVVPLLHATLHSAHFGIDSGLSKLEFEAKNSTMVPLDMVRSWATMHRSCDGCITPSQFVPAFMTCLNSCDSPCCNTSCWVYSKNLVRNNFKKYFYEVSNLVKNILLLNFSSASGFLGE